MPIIPELNWPVKENTNWRCKVRFRCFQYIVLVIITILKRVLLMHHHDEFKDAIEIVHAITGSAA